MSDNKYSLVNEKQFFESIRSSGYKSTAKAIAELVDNSIQAGASNVVISFDVKKDLGNGRKKDRIQKVFIVDDGKGMNRPIMREGLRIGGTERFKDQTNLGRFGMGLKNATFSQCKRLEVYTWADHISRPLYAYLDIDEITKGQQTFIPRPDFVDDAEFKAKNLRPSNSGTAIVWRKCDLLEREGIHRVIAQNLRDDLGQIFRKFLIGHDFNITVAGEKVKPFDPLFIDTRCEFSGASLGGEKEIDVGGIIDGIDGKIIVRLAIYPESWQRDFDKYKNSEPELHRLIQQRHDNSRGFSIMRHNREIDRGLFAVCRPHWDDKWWAGEISFEPELDDLFSVTNTKQQVTFNTQLRQRLKSELSSLLRPLKDRIFARKETHQSAKYIKRSQDIAAERGIEIGQPLCARNKTKSQVNEEIESYVRQHSHIPNIHDKLCDAHETGQPFIIEQDKAPKEDWFFEPVLVGEVTVVRINECHAFYDRLYTPLHKAEKTGHVGCELLILAFLKAYLILDLSPENLCDLTEQWGSILITYLNTPQFDLTIESDK